MKISEILSLIPIILSIFAILHAIGNSILNISIHEKTTNVKGFSVKEINITLIVVFIMYLSGLFVGFLTSYTNIYLQSFPIIILTYLSIIMRDKSRIKFFKNGYVSQIAVYYLVPLIVGIVWGGNISDIMMNLTVSPITAAYQISIMILALLTLLIFIGRYKYINYKNNKKIMITLNESKVTGILISETSLDIYIEVNNKVHRIPMSEVKYIEEK